MDFTQIRAVVEVARLHSFSRAADALGLTQPAISSQVRQIEEEVGYRLFDRLGRNVYLTQPGVILADYGRRLLQLRREATRALTDLETGPTGRLVVGATEAVCLYVLPPILKEFQSRHKGVSLSIFRHHTDRIVRKLVEGVIDVGFISLPVAGDELEVTPILRDRWMVALPTKHPLAGAARVKIEDLLPYPFILPEAGHTRQTMDRLLAPYRRRYTVAFEVAGVEVIKRFVAEGMGVSFISERYVRDEVATGRLKLVPLAGAPLNRDIGLAVRKGQYHSQALEALVAVAKKFRKTR